jgi:hypothetical protein
VIIEAALATAAFLSTTALAPPWLFGVVVIAGVARSATAWKCIEIRRLVIALCIVAVPGLMAMPLGGEIVVSQAIPSVGLPLPLMCILGLLSTAVAGPRFRQSFVLLVIFEVAMGLVESWLGVRSVLPHVAVPRTEMGESDLLYLNRVFGLSTNSSAFAAKVLWSMVLIGFKKWELGTLRAGDYVAYLLLLSGFAVNFSRAACAAAVLSALIFAWQHGRFVGSVAVGFVSLGLMLAWNQILMEVSRGVNGVDLSDRDQIGAAFLEFIRERPWFGNFGAKYFIALPGQAGGSEIYHAHNSFLQVAATSGLPLLAVLCLGCLQARQQRLLLVLPLLGYSMLQYGVFWGASVYDQLFWAVLLCCPVHRRFSNTDRVTSGVAFRPSSSFARA